MHRARTVEPVGTILVTAAVSLTIIEYFGASGSPEWLLSVLRAVGLDSLARDWEVALFESAHREFWQLLFWGAVRVVAYIALPLAVAAVARLGPIGDLGLRVRGMARHALPYLGLYVLVVPFIVAVSYDSAFQERYPFYDPVPGDGLWPYVIGWWAIYAVQFVGVEIFFRGFLVLGLAPRLGTNAVYVSAVPYLMIHFGKPLAETAGAIVAALVLGTLALRYRSIWWGAALHIAVAVTLDVLALGHAGFF